MKCWGCGSFPAQYFFKISSKMYRLQEQPKPNTKLSLFGDLDEQHVPTDPRDASIPPPTHTAVARTSLPLTFSSSSQRIHNPSPPHAHRHAFVAERTHARRCSRVATHVLLCLCCVLTNVGRCVPSASTPHRHLLWHALVAGGDHHHSKHIHNMHLPCPSTHEPLRLNRASAE